MLKVQKQHASRVKDLHRYFTEENIQMADVSERCSDSLIIREVQNKAIVRYHYVPTRMAIMKKIDNSKCE